MNSFPDLSDRIADYDFELPEHLIAQEPALTRTDARLLLVRRHPTGGLPRFEDLKVSDLPQLAGEVPELRNSLWIRNRSRVIPARFYARRPSGSRHEIVLLEEIAPNTWTALVRGQSSFKYPQPLIPEKDASVQLESTEAGVVRFAFSNDAELRNFLERCGEMPLPPYIKTRIPSRDSERYQTTWAQEEKAASVAAPTASLHFTPELCRELEQRGIHFADVVLHVGLGTFEPVRTEKLSEHQLHSERIEIPRSSWTTFQEARSQKRPFLCVGTTAMRTLESLSLQGEASREGVSLQESLEGWQGRSALFVRPGFEFRYTNALLTNFHLPQSTLLVLVSSFAGSRRLALEAYEHAVKKSYRFFSFGDASLWI